MTTTFLNFANSSSADYELSLLFADVAGLKIEGGDYIYKENRDCGSGVVDCDVKDIVLCLTEL